MIAYAYDEDMNYVGEQERQLDPLESMMAGKEVYLMPANCTLKKPPKEKDGYDIFFNGEGWEYREKVDNSLLPPYEPTLQEKAQMTQGSYAYQLKELDLMRVVAHVDGDTELAEELAAEREELLEEYAKELEALNNGD